MTASEPLSLEDEYRMQQSWRNDPDKLTFISCLPLSSRPVPKAAEGANVRLTHDDAPDRMLGDVNLFLKFEDEDGDDGGSDQAASGRHPPVIGEVELMIAERDNQGQGFGRASLLCFLHYIVAHEEEILREFLRGHGDANGVQARGDEGRLQEELRDRSLAYLVVRIGVSNERSIALFESLGFRKVKEEPNYFGELELRRYELGVEVVKEMMSKYGIADYEEITDVS